MPTHEFLQTSNKACESAWSTWPEMQERAIESGTVLVWNMGTSVGHYMRALIYVLPLVRLLEVGFILNLRPFPAFGVAFEPAAVKWDVEAAPFMRRALSASQGVTSDGKHALVYRRGTFILSDTQFDRLAETLGVEGQDRSAMRSGLDAKLSMNWRGTLSGAGLTPPPPCVWNMLLRRSERMMSSIEAHTPWGDPMAARGTPYSAWHIRTSEGETPQSYSPERNVYIFNDQSPDNVCPIFISTKEKVRAACPRLAATEGLPMPLFIASNSKGMARNCSATAGKFGFKAGFVDLGISPEESHTAFSKNPDTVVNAFIDFLYMMDASAIVSTGSSFSFAVAEIKGYQSHLIAGRDSIEIMNKLFIFVPTHSSDC